MSRDEHELSKPGRVYEPKPWREGHHAGEVVADESLPGMRLAEPFTADLAYYGGVLVCESVPSRAALAVIRAAPEMLALLREWAEVDATVPGEPTMEAIAATKALVERVDAEIRAAMGADRG